MSRAVAPSRRSSNQTKRTCASIALTMSSSLPFSTKEREDSTMRTLRRLAGGDQIERAGGEIEHRRDPPGRLHRHERDRGAVGVGQHQRNRLARARDVGDLSREQRDADAETRGADSPADRVLHDRAPARQAAKVEAALECLMQGSPIVGGVEHEVRHDVVERRRRPRAGARGALRSGSTSILRGGRMVTVIFGKPAASDLRRGSGARTACARDRRAGPA